MHRYMVGALGLVAAAVGLYACGGDDSSGSSSSQTSGSGGSGAGTSSSASVSSGMGGMGSSVSSSSTGTGGSDGGPPCVADGKISLPICSRPCSDDAACCVGLPPGTCTLHCDQSNHVCRPPECCESSQCDDGQECVPINGYGVCVVPCPTGSCMTGSCTGTDQNGHKYCRATPPCSVSGMCPYGTCDATNEVCVCTGADCTAMATATECAP